MRYYPSGLLPSSSRKIYRLKQSDFQKMESSSMDYMGRCISVREIHSIRTGFAERDCNRSPTVRSHYVYC